MLAAAGIVSSTRDRQVVAGHGGLGERRKIQRRLEGPQRGGRRIGGLGGGNRRMRRPRLPASRSSVLDDDADFRRQLDPRCDRDPVGGVP